ncbi:MAG TPA: exodeoxyribonuclease VII small subunit [Polyangia bacterium]|nr:exodeoxyribonuclease VII small subunit [Polyangia bacterium]
MPKGTSTDEGGAAGDAPAERFEDLLGRLRGLVERLESGNLPLEESLKAFEEGMELCKRGALVLDGAEKKVEMLLGTGAGGAAATAPFSMPEE